MAFVSPIPLSSRKLANSPKIVVLSGSHNAQNQMQIAKSSTRSRIIATADGDFDASTTTAPPFSAKGMTVDDFFTRSIGEWRSQRSSHNLAWTQFEQITSEIVISKVPESADEIIALCKQNEVAVADTTFSLKMSWEGETDWDEEVSEGESTMSVIKDGPTHGRLLRSVGYAETIPAVGKWYMTDEGVFVLNTFYDVAAAEERIWFATPDLRMRVSQIRTSSGTGVVTASFSTEIRRLKLDS